MVAKQTPVKMSRVFAASHLMVGNSDVFKNSIRDQLCLFPCLMFSMFICTVTEKKKIMSCTIYMLLFLQLHKIDYVDQGFSKWSM